MTSFYQSFAMFQIYTQLLFGIFGYHQDDTKIFKKSYLLFDFFSKFYILNIL